MLRFTNRFHGHGSLRYIYKNGQALRSHSLTLRYIENSRRKTPRVSIVVSKKILKSAVGRNRIRRRLYEIVRHELPHLKPNLDMVILVFHADIRTQLHDELQKQLRQIFSEAGLYK